MAFLMFDRICTVIEHIAEMGSIILEMTLNIAAFVLKVAAIVFIVAAIVLLIGGIILLFVLFGDKIAEAVKKIIEVFAMVGGMIYDAIVGFFKMLADIVVTVIFWLYGGLIEAIVKGFKWLFVSSDEEEKKSKTEQETTIKDGVTKDVFKETLKPVTSALTDISACLATLASAEMLRALNPIGSMFSSIATSAMSLFSGNNTLNTTNADNTNTAINTNYVNNQQSDDLNKTLRENVDAIAKLLKKWDKNTDNDRNKHPNQIDNAGG